MTKKNIISLLFISLFTVITIGCSEDSSSVDPGAGGRPGPTKVPTPTPTPTSTPGPTPTPTPTPIAPHGKPGEFISNGSVNAVQVSKYYSWGCKSNGSPEGAKMIDPRLSAGDIFKDRVFMKDPTNNITFDLQSTVASVSNWESVHNTRVLASNNPGIRVGQNSQTICTVVNADEGSCEGQSSASFGGFKFFIIIPLGGEQSTYEEGWFVLEDGVGVPAWKEVKVASGLLVDPEQFNIGKMGTQTVTEIRLPTIPSTGVDFCGGTSGYSETLIQDDNGVVLNKIGGQLLGVKLFNQP
jgi:hypothetical protein